MAPLEQWLLSRLQATIAEVRVALDTYQIRRAVTAVDAFIHDDLSNWYVRRRRREFWKGTLDPEKQAAFQVLYHVLVRVCQLLAPVMPFITEHVYQNLVRAVSPDAPVSLHLTGFPEPDPARAQPDLEADVAAARRVLQSGPRGPQRRAVSRSGSRSRGPSWWRPPTWSAPCEPSSPISSTS